MSNRRGSHANQCAGAVDNAIADNKSRVVRFDMSGPRMKFSRYPSLHMAKLPQVDPPDLADGPNMLYHEIMLGQNC